MAKPGRGIPSTGSVSRSGFWLIGGALLLSVVVLAWAFQEEPAGQSARVTRRGTTPRSSSPRGPSVQIEPQSESDPLARAPSVADYGPLLQRNVFRPLVVPKDTNHVSTARSGSASGGSGSVKAVKASQDGVAGPGTPDAWRGWQFSGVAQLDQKTYALMDQPGNKQSRFVQPGDKLEDATVARVVADEVTLREAGGEIIHVHRVDVMAELLRPGRSGSRSPRGPAAPSNPAVPAAPTAPAGPGTRTGPVVTTTPNLETLRGISPASSALQRFREARRALRQRAADRFEAGGNPAVSED